MPRLVLEHVGRQVLRHGEHERQHGVAHGLVLPLPHEARQHAQAQHALVKVAVEGGQVAHERVLLRRVALQDAVDEAQRAEQTVVAEERRLWHRRDGGPRMQRLRQHRPQQLLHAACTLARCKARRGGGRGWREGARLQAPRQACGGNELHAGQHASVLGRRLRREQRLLAQHLVDDAGEREDVGLAGDGRVADAADKLRRRELHERPRDAVRDERGGVVVREAALLGAVPDVLCMWGVVSHMLPPCE